MLDESAVRSIELVRTLAGGRKGSLLSLVDSTRTALGARLLRRRILAPLIDLAGIRRRHDAVEAFVRDATLRESLRDALKGLGDLERLTTRASHGLATPRDLGLIRHALRGAAGVATLLASGADRTTDDALQRLVPSDVCADVRDLLETALLEEALPVVVSGGGIIREKVDPDLDDLRTLSAEAKDVSLELEARESGGTEAILRLAAGGGA